MTMAAQAWDRIEPAVACTSPDGHEHVALMTAGSSIPESILCPRCGEAWTIVLLPREPVA